MAGERPNAWTRRVRERAGGVRTRTTVVAALVVGVVLLAGAAAFIAILRNALVSEAQSAARLRAEEVAAVLVAGEPLGSLAVGDPEEQLVQVVDGGFGVVASSPNVTGLAPVAQLEPGQSARVDAPVGEGTFVVAAVGANGPDGPLTVLAARTLEDVSESIRVATTLLGIGLPVLLGLVSIIIWRVVGRALAPVEAIRREVEEVSAAALHRRVPEPSGDDEISRLARTMNQMLGRLERAAQRQRRFVSDASHELRSPVASIRAHAEVALAHPGATTAAELAETVLAEDLRVQRLVEDLLLLARVDEGSLELHRRQVDLDDLVFEEANRLRAETALAIDTSAVSAARVLADPDSLRRVLRNLGDNAARHARSRLAFALASSAAGARLTVEDDGPGIPVADRERIFERFVRLDDARARDNGGSGLGLAIVGELVAATGGTVRVVESGLGGARFEITLPSLS